MIAFYTAKASSEKLVSSRPLNHLSALAHTISIAKTVEIDKLRFTDKDLDTLGTLDRGQFGVVSFPSFFTSEILLNALRRSILFPVNLMDGSTLANL